jgi:hypothetical protein
LALTKSTSRHMALLLILYSNTQNFCHMFQLWTPWKRSSSNGHFSSWTSTFFSYTSIITNCTKATISKSNITAYVYSLCTFFKLFYFIYFSSILIVFCQLFTWIAPNDVDYIFHSRWQEKLILQKESKWAVWYITDIINPYTWQIAWQWCHFLVISYRWQGQSRTEYDNSS